MTYGIHAEAENCNWAPTHFVSCVTIHLQQPTGPNVTKKIQKMPDRRKGDVNNIVLGIQVLADGLKQIEVEERIQIVVLRIKLKKNLESMYNTKDLKESSIL